MDIKTPDTLLAVAEAALARAAAHGADAADVDVIDGRSVSATSRLGKMEDISRAEGRDLSLRVFVGQSSAVVSTNEFSQPTLDGLAERAVAMARLAPPDRYAGIAAAELLATDWPDLDLNDDTAPGADALFETALEAEDAARAVDGVSNSLGASASAAHREIVLATSAGFAASYRASRFSVSAGAVAGTGTGMENDYAFTSARHHGDLAGAHEIGHEAGTRAVRRLGAARPETFTGTVVFDPRVGRSLVGHLATAISGQAVARGATFLKSKLGEQVFAAGISIVDDPLRRRGPASRPFDGEGLPSVRRALVDDGRLTGWILDLASARQLGLDPTGQAARGGGTPGPSAANVSLEPGKVSAEALVAGVERGVFVTGTIGMGVNIVTGDYSRGANGFLIEKGEITRPVSEFTIAGHLLKMFAALTPADDLTLKYGTDAPTLMVEGMTVAGT
jgi:PmbA protein